ncbi:MAG: hypothetical protein ACOC4C_04790 [Fibrobacterota bacterium]
MNTTASNILIWTMVLCGVLSAGQVTFRQLLVTAQTDPVVLSQDNTTAAVRKSFPGIPGIDDIEFEVSNTGFDPNESQYKVQVQPRGILETQAARRYNDAIISNAKAKRLQLLNTALYNRYLLYVDLLEYKKLHALYDDLLTVYDDRINVMENSTYSEDFKMERLIEEEKDRTREKMKSLEVEKFISVLNQRAAIFLSDTSFSGFDTSGLVSVETIMNRIETEDYSLDTNNAYFNVYHSELDVAHARHRLEVAENRRYIDAVSFTYDNGDMLDEYDRKFEHKSYDHKKAFELEIAVRIPRLTRANHDLNRRRSDLLGESENLEQIHEKLSEKVRKDLADLQQLIAQHQYLSARETEVDAEASLKKFLQIDGVDPLILLEIKENIIKNKIEMISIRCGILRNYMYVVDNAGMLSREPIRNYLSEDMEEIKK